jgi:Putative beta-barrel porin 2
MRQGTEHRSRGELTLEEIMSSLRVLAGGVLLGSGSFAFAGLDSPLTRDSAITWDSPYPYDLFVADQFTYDENLYGLPSDVNASTAAGPLATRADSFNSVSLGGDGRWFSDNQAIGFNFRADQNSYTHNDSLNNISGKGNLEWDWRLATQWSGEVGGSYFRGLANFANTGYYARDVVEREDYFGTIRYQLGPHWSVYGGVIGADTQQTAVPEQLYDYHSNAGNAGITLATSSQNSISFDYRYTDATFPQDFIVNGAPFNSNYREDTERIVVKYVISAATELDASAGYLKRDYPVSEFATFSGDIWRAALQWQPTDRFQIIAAGWRDLVAYVDSQSDYFVSTGASLTPVWVPTETLTLGLAVSRENHNYIDSSPSALTFVSRYDTLTSAIARLVYAPTYSLTFNLTCRYDKRGSNLPQFSYNDTLAAIGVTYKIGRRESSPSDSGSRKLWRLN